MSRTSSIPANMEEAQKQLSEIMKAFIGWPTIYVYGACLTGAIVAAKKLGLNKLDVQKDIVENWK